MIYGVVIRQLHFYFRQFIKVNYWKIQIKSYNTRILKLTEKRLAQINKILKDYDDDEMEKVFLREHKERQKLIKPVEPIWEMKVNQWLE